MLGAILVPLNIRLSASELAFILDDAGVGVLFVHPDLEALASQVAVLSTTPRHIVPLWSEDRAVTTYDSLIDGVTAGPYPSPPIRESDVVEIFYTSGTTGRPKGVMLSHRNVYALALQVAAQLPVTESDVFLHSLPMYHANGWEAPHRNVHGCESRDRAVPARGTGGPSGSNPWRHAGLYGSDDGDSATQPP
jgi:fatty-acyl-CoA synthase